MFEVKFQKKVLILSVILGVLIVTYALGIIFSPANVRKREEGTPLFPILNKDLILHIEISSGDDVLTLKKTGDAWTVLINGIYFPASESRVDSFFDHIIFLNRARIITGDPEKRGDFELEGDVAGRIKLFDGSERSLVDLFIGKEASGGQGSFVRIEGSNEIIQVDKSFSFYLNTERKFWSYLKLFPADLRGEDIIRISVTAKNPPLNYTLVLDNDRNWEVAGREELVLANDKVDALTNALVSFEGTEFVAGISEDEAGFADSQGEVLFSTSGDRSFRLLIGNEQTEDDQYFVKLDGETYSYLAAKWRIERIFKTVQELLEEEK